ncbi:MAG TPA: hypothetical protein VK658_13425 [Chryseolinea sp.]|nr:hypothetical protein [Chryseolinea sp.]
MTTAKQNLSGRRSFMKTTATVATGLLSSVLSMGRAQNQSPQTTALILLDHAKGIRHKSERLKDDKWLLAVDPEWS